jgi:outer membrane protein assembly factor BamB
MTVTNKESYKMRLCVLLGAVLLCLCPALAQTNWPDWRGPAADGHTQATGLPLRWSETENVVWKTAIHDLGHSTPVVWDDQVWLTTATEDGTVFYAIGIDAKSGDILHDREVFRAEEPQHINPLNTYATPSPCIEEGRVYVHFGTFGTAAIDTASGDILWRRSDLNCDHMQGPASSPVLFENLLILTIEGTEDQFIVALDKDSGDTVWRFDRPADLYTPEIAGVYKKSYQTPVFIEHDGRPRMISNGALQVTAHEPRTGDVIWEARYRDDSTISRIVTGQGLLFINTGGNPGGSELWAMRPGGTGDVTESHVVWKLTEDAPHQSSPVLVDGLLYYVTDQCDLCCLEATTGNPVWTADLRDKFGASPLAAPGRIYLPSMKGTTTVIAPGREYRELAVNHLDGELWASPAVTGNALLLRTKTHLYRIGE